MILYQENLDKFYSDCFNPKNGKHISDLILFEMLKRNLPSVSHSEKASWEASLPPIAELLKTNDIDGDIDVAIEYKIIDTKQRIDFLIYGLDEKNQKNLVLVELKQWSDCKRSSLQNYIRTNGGNGVDDYWHPSYQAFNYGNIISSFNEYVYKNDVHIKTCSYLGNMKNGFSTIIKDINEYPLITESPCYLEDDEKKLVEFIKKYVKKPCKEILYEIEGSRVRPSENFANMLYNAITGEPFFSYDENQAYSVSKIINEVEDALNSGRKKTIIIKGGPGSGKSVVAMNVLGQLVKRKINACYVTSNFTPKTFLKDILIAKDFKKSAIAELFKGPKVFASSGVNDFDCVIVDEAHRMYKRKFGLGVKKDVDLVDSLFRASRVLVFLIDEDQIVTRNDFVTIEKIEEYSKAYKTELIENEKLELTTQFRCIGGEQYIEFVNKILGYKNSFYSLRGVKYKLKIVDTIDELIKIRDKYNQNNHQMRLMAGYTKQWKSKDDINEYDFIYPNGIKLKWNIKKTNMAAINDSSQINNVFCIHTLQGLEVEYAGVIIGEDLIYNEEKKCIEFHKEKIAKSDTISGIRTAPYDEARRMIQNTYKVLLTRGIKGTYIYAEDQSLRKYLKDLVEICS